MVSANYQYYKDWRCSKKTQADIALLTCSGKNDSRSMKVKSESNMTQTRKEKKTSKDEKKTELTCTLVQRIKQMNASKVFKNRHKL